MLTLSCKKREYKKQPFFRYCGAFQIAHIHNTLKEQNISYKKIFKGIKKITGFCKPMAIKEKLTSLGHKTEYKIFKKPEKEILIKNLTEQKISILLIGHGYNKNGKNFSHIKAIFFQHYISIRGYNSKKKEFLVYDSAQDGQKNQTIGNIRLSENILLKARKRGGLQKNKNILLSITTKDNG